MVKKAIAKPAIANDVNADPEFSRPIKIDEIGIGDSLHIITASEPECAALAVRFELLHLCELRAEISLSRQSGGTHNTAISARGRVTAHVQQLCIASSEAIADIIDEAVDMVFVPVTAMAIVPETDVELTAEDCDIMEHDGRVVDIGEAVAQSLALAINPYPRSNDAEQRLRAAGVKRDDDVVAPSGPFAALSAIKDQLARK